MEMNTKQKIVQMGAEVLSEAQATGEISKDLNVKEAAGFIVAGWHGALIHMKVSQSVEPLKNHKKFVLNYVLKP